MSELPEAEWLTRKRRVDPRLKAQGWAVVPFDPAAPQAASAAHAVTEYPTENGPASNGAKAVPIALPLSWEQPDGNGAKGEVEGTADVPS